jgi:hypothetical protein
VSEKKIIIPDWNESEFLAFVLLYGANIDMEYTDEEKAIIQQIVDRDHYTKIRDFFESLNDTQCLQIIQEFKGLYYPTADRTDLLLSKLDELFASDGVYSNIETVCRQMLNRLL